MRFIVEGPVSMWMPIAVACLLAAGAAGAQSFPRHPPAIRLGFRSRPS